MARKDKSVTDINTNTNTNTTTDAVEGNTGEVMTESNPGEVVSNADNAEVAATAATATVASTTGMGKAVILPNGEERVSYIRRRYYTDGATRSDITKEVNEMLTTAGIKTIPYQIVFAATRDKVDPRVQQHERAEVRAVNKAAKDAEKARVKAEKAATKEAEKAAKEAAAAEEAQKKIDAANAAASGTAEVSEVVDPNAVIA